MSARKQSTTKPSTTPTYLSPRQPSTTPRDGAIQQEMPQFLTWQLDENNDIINFTLTKCRMDVLNRLKYNRLYTLEEAKILLKQVLKVVTKHAETDLKNLMFLSRYRTEKLYPKPIVANWIDPEGSITQIGGFQDSEEFMDIINRTYEGKPAKRPQRQQKSEEAFAGSTTDGALNGTEQHSPRSTTNVDTPERDSTTQNNINHEDTAPTNSPFNKSTLDDDDSNVSMVQSKEKLQSLVWRINQSLVKLIDSSLKQRRERLLLSATILEELESMPELKKALQDKFDYSLHASVASRQKQQSGKKK